jgi:hypothetical protein
METMQDWKPKAKIFRKKIKKFELLTFSMAMERRRWRGREAEQLRTGTKQPTIE